MKDRGSNFLCAWGSFALAPASTIARIACLAAIPCCASPSSLVVVEDFAGRRASGTASVAVAEDIRHRVIHAGGNVDGVVVISLSWFSADDLDLHVVTPGGAEINYQRKTSNGGELDVDMCVQGRHGGVCKDNPVENVVFAESAPGGHFEVYVQNFNYHADVRSRAVQAADVLEGRKQSKEDHAVRIGRDRPVPFEVLVKAEQTHRLFSGLCTPVGKTHASSNTRVFAFDYHPDAKDETERVVPIFEAQSDLDCIGFGKRHPQLGGPERREALPSDSGASRAAKQSKIAGAADARRPRSQFPAAGGPDRTASAVPPKPRQKGKKKQKLEQKRLEALGSIHASSRSTLLSKPVKVLQELLRDIGATCRGCLDKADIVDKLLDVSGANDVSGATVEL